MSYPLRSLLFVPGDSEKKLAKAASSAADALILDLEDSVSESRKAIARAMTADYLEHDPSSGELELWVRINPLTTSHALRDLAAVVAAGPAGIMIPKITGTDDVTTVCHYLDALEETHGLEPGATRVLPVATETPRSALRLADFADCSLSRLYGLTWGAEDLSACLGASTNVGPSGDWTTTYLTVRSLMLLAARAANVEAVETLYSDLVDTAGLASSTARAKAEGFSGRIAIHPSQVEVINGVFASSPSELEYARRVVDAFASGSGVVQLDGKMLDAPHLKQAHLTISRAGEGLR